jgi:hypothetical protein
MTTAITGASTINGFKQTWDFPPEQEQPFLVFLGAPQHEHTILETISGSKKIKITMKTKHNHQHKHKHKHKHNHKHKHTFLVLFAST